MSDVDSAVFEILRNAAIADIEHEAISIIKAAEVSGQSAVTMAQQRARGTPLAYITGRQRFMGIEMLVAPGALIPRAETELLCKTALTAISITGNPSPLIIDMCCGSGNLACALAHHVPGARVWASDLTENCVEVASKNTEYTGVSERVVVGQGDLFEGLSGYRLEKSIDVIVCNPPYISQGKLAAERAGLLEHEPREAFDGGPYGLSIHQRVSKEALPYLKEGGYLLFEIGLGQERQVRMLLERAGEYTAIELVSNAAGEARVIMARKSPA